MISPVAGGENGDVALAAMRKTAARTGGCLYLGAGAIGPAWAGAEQAVLVLGPPRSGKTSGLVVPTVLGAPGAVVSTSTKPDVLRITAGSRRGQGRCFLYDPSGTVEAPDGVERVRWSPVSGCRSWDDALLVARGLVGSARPTGGRGDGGEVGLDHWSERAQALLAPVLHAAALDGAELATVLSWIDRRQVAPALRVLEQQGAVIAGDLLAGIASTDSREQSGIWSTASGVLGAYRSEAALATTVAPDFDPRGFCDSSGTLYICATGRHQGLAAPLVVGLLTDIRAAAYGRAAEQAAAADSGSPDGRGGGRRSAPTPVVLALDEVANIAPVPDLPAMVSEGGSQGVVTLACLQDLSQARGRWGGAADGFLSLFGTTVVLPGIGDVQTLDALSQLAGEEEVATRSVSAPVREGGRGIGRAVMHRMLWGPGGRGADPLPSVTTSTVLRRRLPVDVVGRGEPGMALVVDERNAMGWVRLTPWFSSEPWRSVVRGAERVPAAVERPAGSFPRPARDRLAGDGGPGGRDLGI
ncbi:MAG TPA: type IV secretory system conjugative DNA transfer family protein [Acidimicrobiales bacterium]|nr:type IV secretory system conjugative DNA transfer family protein [Acidimicrobiales bacterium]